MDGKGRPVSVPRDRALRKKLRDYAVSVVRRLGIKRNLGDYPLPGWVEKRYRDYLRDLIAQEREKLLCKQEGQLTTSELTEIAGMYRSALNDKQRLQVLHTTYSRGGAPAVEALAHVLGTDATYLVLVTKVYLKNIKRLKRGQQLLFFLPPPRLVEAQEELNNLRKFAEKVITEKITTSLASLVKSKSDDTKHTAIIEKKDLINESETEEIFREQQEYYLAVGDGRRGGRLRAEMLAAGHLRAGVKITTTFAS